MTVKPGPAFPPGPDVKKQMLAGVYDVYAQWVERFPLVCRKGCEACCTQSVTMTTLEGAVILDFIRGQEWEKWLLARIAQANPRKSRGVMTTNQFAAACLNQREVDVKSITGWDFSPCIFLADNICTIYAVRPFGCRSFGSLAPCTTDSAAVMAPIHLAVNTVFTQIIEQMNSDGGYWSNMTDILFSLAGGDKRDEEILLLPARPVPGFLLAPHEMQEVRALLQQLHGQFPEKGLFGDLIDKFLPI